MRWRIALSYDGTHFSGWQKQPGEITVQQTIEDAFSTILRVPVEVVGCGRTDTGVHSRNYIAHFDAPAVNKKFLYQVNAILPVSIAIKACEQVHDDFHARFDATQRHYVYYMHVAKDPFLRHHSFFFRNGHELDRQAMQSAAAQLLNHSTFFPFCKTGSDVHHYKCILTKSEFVFEEGQIRYHISANRFLRGMVRLIVGALLNVGLGKLTWAEIEEALVNQTPLALQWSVPAEGLFLEEINYH